MPPPLLLLLMLPLALLAPPPPYQGAVVPGAYAQTLDVFTDNAVYTDDNPLFVYGRAAPGEDLVIRLIAPDETIAKFDQIKTGADGGFSHLLHTWPAASINFPYGTYVVEMISTAQNGVSKTLEVKFLPTTDLVQIPIERHVDTTVFAPETSAVNNPVRIFVQITSDGLLVGEDNPEELLQTSHVHLPDETVDDISATFVTLHNGLYYADYVPAQEGTHVFHIVSFNQGSISHGSAATSVLSQDLGGISEEIDRLNTILDDTATELVVLKSDVSEFEEILGRASTNIDSGVSSITESVKNTSEASAQLNSLLFPIVASMGIIVALQIVILARRR